MSLINDALKKAQKQRTGEAPALGSMPSIGGSSARQIASRSKSGGGNTALIIGGIAAGLLTLVIVGYLTLRPAAKPPASLPAVAQQTAGQTPGLQQQTTVQAVSSPSPAASNPSPTFTLHTAPLPEVAQQGTSVQTTSTPVAKPRDEPASLSAVGRAKAEALASSGSPQPVSPVPAASAPPPAAPVRPLDARAIEYLDNIKVAGIRASATDAKVLMNDRVYRVGSVVNGEMGLRLVGITANTLTFEDPAGGRYTRTF